MEKITIPVIFSFDENMSLQAGVATFSLLINASENVEYDVYYLIQKDIDNKQKQMFDKLKYLKSCANITFINVGNAFSNAYEVRNVTIASYYRLLIPTLFKNYERVIYLDVDIICKTSLEEVYEFDLGDNYIAGVASYICNDIDIEYSNTIGCNSGYYINAGFIVFNIKKILEDSINEKFMELSNNKYLYQDQDIINIACNGKIKMLDVKYNFTQLYYRALLEGNIFTKNFYSFENVKESSKDCIIHYTGNKPWNSLCLRFEEWWMIYKSSPFYTEEFYYKMFENIANNKNLTLRNRIALLIKYFIK